MSVCPCIILSICRSHDLSNLSVSRPAVLSVRFDDLSLAESVGLVCELHDIGLPKLAIYHSLILSYSLSTRSVSRSWSHALRPFSTSFISFYLSLAVYAAARSL